PLAARAQQPPVRPLIGMLVPLSAAAAAGNIAAFRSALRDMGYVEGRNTTLEIRYGDGALDRFATLLYELLAFKPDVLFAGGKGTRAGDPMRLWAATCCARDRLLMAPIGTSLSYERVGGSQARKRVPSHSFH